MDAASLPPALPRFILLYAAMYAAYGVASPFLPAFVNARGLGPEELGLVLAAGTAIRLISAPLAGRIADLVGALRMVLAVCAALAGVVTLGYLSARGFSIFLLLTLFHAAALAPIGMLADALAVRRSFEYGWVRGTGSAAFIVGTLAAGQAVSALGLDVIVLLQSMLLGAAAFCALRVPEIPHERATGERKSAFVLLKIPLYRRLVLVAALILGSHAMHDAFAVIRWSAAGISPTAASLLWSEAVAAEVIVFFFIGPALVRRLTPAGAIAVAACAGVLRWTVMASSTELVPLMLVQPLHGITFALLHLACMRLLVRTAPQGLEATAQALYGTLGIALSALLTVSSGLLYGRVGAQGFFVMAALCALALPLTWRLRT